MTTSSVIVNRNSYQQCFSEILFSNEEELLILSPASYHSENSSPLSYSDLSSNSIGMEVSSPSTSSMCSTSSCYPYLTVLEQPKDQLRFRYKSEKGCHGGLKPVVKLHNWENSDDLNLWIKATLYTCGSCPTLHVFELDGKQCRNGVAWQKVSKDFTAKFPALSICMKKKDEISDILRERVKQGYKEQKKRINAQDIEKEVQEKMKALNLNSGQLCFEAFYDKNGNNPVPEISPVFSRPIYNQKCTLAGELKITRLSSYSGKASGGEDMILLCEKIRKEDIEIIFSCQNEQIIWEEKATFNPADVHHQVAIPFKTPRFIQNIEQEVSIRLRRKTDNKDGEPRAFFYKPCDDFEGNPLKRKRPNPSGDFPLSFPDTQYETSSSTNFDDNNQNLISDIFIRSILDCADDWPLPFDEVSQPTASMPVGQMAMPFDTLNPEGILNLSSLNLGEKPGKKRSVDAEWTVTNTSSYDPKYFQMLKTGIIGLLKENGSNTFLRFLPALLSMKDENLNSLLHLAVTEKSENLPLIIKMVEAAPKGVIDQTNKAGMTPLHIAMSKGLWKVVRILLMSGANPNVKDKNGNTCTHLATMYNLSWCLAEVLAPLLGDKKRKHRPLINTLNYEGLAPLHLSVRNDSKECVKLLLQARANINIQDGKCGKTPLHLAYEKNSVLVNLLQSQPNIDLNAEDFNGNTANPRMSKGNKSSTVIPKPTECCIELSTESSNSNEDEGIEIKEEKSIKIEKDVKNKQNEKHGEDLFCKTLDSNGLWKKMGLYVMDEKEISVIGLMDTTPTRTILKELKKLHKEKYPEKLKYILSDSELKEFAQLLTV